MTAQQHNGTILIVEDNQLDLDLTLRAFKVNGVTNPVQVCRDGVEALDYIHARNAFAAAAPVPALVLLDLKMPKVDGFQVLKALRAEPRYKTVPVVVLSTSREERDIATAYASGANSYVDKGVNYDRFIEVMRHISVYWLTVNRTLPA
jgi:CheY-like chemotaxis protein